jgi:outer membrane protein assembly factor BamE (lipoprotein component of BamABCDE complex)
MKHILAATLIAAVFGCASSGPRIDAAQLYGLRQGQTTASEIYKQFGRPSFLSRNMDGTQTAVYVHADGKPGTSIVPVVGSLGGNAPSGSETVTFYFDSNGILTNYRSSQTSAATAAVEAAQAATVKTAPESAAKTTQSAAGNAPQVTSVKVIQPAVAKPEPGKSIQLNLPDFLPSATKDPRNP